MITSILRVEVLRCSHNERSTRTIQFQSTLFDLALKPGLLRIKLETLQLQFLPAQLLELVDVMVNVIVQWIR